MSYEQAIIILFLALSGNVLCSLCKDRFSHSGVGRNRCVNTELMESSCCERAVAENEVIINSQRVEKVYCSSNRVSSQSILVVKT